MLMGRGFFLPSLYDMTLLAVKTHNKLPRRSTILPKLLRGGHYMPGWFSGNQQREMMWEK
jgi:hypothetical protein